MVIFPILVILISWFVWPNPTRAADFPGVTVSPAVLKLDLATDSENFTFKYTNTSPTALQLTFSAKDFTGLEEGWRVKFLTPEDAENYHYSLSSWLQFDPPGMLLQPQESSNLTVNIRKASLTPGGHYASIVADISPVVPVPGAVTIKSQLVSLAFIRAHTGSERDEAKISSFSFDRTGIFSVPYEFSLRFDNTGNTQLTPHGLVAVNDIFNRVVSRSILNEDSLITLPESIRKYEMPSDLPQNSWLLPGRYTVRLNVSYASDKTLTQEINFVTLGGKNLQIIEFLLLVLLAISLKHAKTRKQLRPKLT